MMSTHETRNMSPGHSNQEVASASAMGAKGSYLPATPPPNTKTPKSGNGVQSRRGKGEEKRKRWKKKKGKGEEKT